MLKSIPAAPRRRIAIVSTYDELCGIAGYTRALEKQLAPHVELTVFDLDQYLLRSKHKRVQRLADEHIREIAAALKGFDCVNLQLEHGTLGRTTRQILHRFRMLADAAPALSVTMHTVLVQEDLPLEVSIRLLLSGHLPSLGKVIDLYIKGLSMGRGIQGYLHRLQEKKPVSIIVHTKRDMRIIRDLYRINNVYHHPLSFIPRPLAQHVRRTTGRAAFPLLQGLPENARLIGTFGFLSPYKGFETAVQALKFLPEDHHLLIFGGLHPQGIRREEPIDPYILKLLRAARIGQTPLDHIKESNVAISPSGDMLTLIADHPKSMQNRIHFMGALSDDEFYAAMALCDVAVFPYMEVGQSSSGPISIAIEMGTRVIASRTAAFRAYARYHPGRVEFFDIGNYAELATRILAAGPQESGAPALTHDTDTNAALYLRANGVALVPESQPVMLASAAE